MAELLLGGALALSLTAYSLLGGADFGGGVWDLLAHGPRQAAQRALVARAIGPVWEVNHVWLILAVVLLFSAFPRAFAALFTALNIPLTLFLLGVVFRGAAFAFRTFELRSDAAQRRWGLVFSCASVVSPLLLGVCAGAASQPGLLAAGRGGWLGLFPLAVGLLALALFSYLAAVYLCAETTDAALADDFRRRALASFVVATTLALATLPLAAVHAPGVFRGLLGSPWAGALVVGTAAAAAAALAALLRRRFRRARIFAAAQVGGVVLGWALARSPYLVEPEWTLASAAAPEATLRLLLAGLAAGAVVLVPALLLLFRVFKTSPAA